jgi:hypothetical protein
MGPVPGHEPAIGERRPHRLAAPGCRMAIRGARLLLLVGVEDRGDAFGIGGEGLDAGALDLQ